MKILKTFTLLIAIFIASNMYAQPVTLDPTFGENGMTITQSALYGDAFVFDKSGNIITACTAGSTVVMIKTNADGIIDQNFGVNGQILIPENYITSGFTSLKITGENKILLLGQLTEWPDNNVILRRFNEDGSVDNTFGDNGIMHLSALTGAHYPIYISSVNLENNDFMLITMTEYDYYGIASKSYTTKYNYNGELEKSFGENGKVYLTDNKSFNIHPRIFSTKILSDQSILIAGRDNFNSGVHYDDGKFAFCKLSIDGHFISDFLWINDDSSDRDVGFNSIIEDTNGNLLLAGQTEVGWHTYHYLIYSFYPDGTLNSDFGKNGYLRPFDNPVGMRILQNGDKYLIRDRYNIMSINHNGTLDTTFNNTGLFRCENSTFRNMSLQDTTKLIVLGSYNNNFAIARLNIPYKPVISVKETLYTENRISIFPNPTTGVLNLIQEKIENGALNLIQGRIENVEIFDVYGRKLLSHHLIISSSNYLINIAHFPAGIYFVRITTEKGEVVKRVVKQ